MHSYIIIDSIMYSKPLTFYVMRLSYFSNDKSHFPNNFFVSESCFGKYFFVSESCFGKYFFVSESCFGKYIFVSESCFGKYFFLLESTFQKWFRQVWERFPKSLAETTFPKTFHVWHGLKGHVTHEKFKDVERTLNELTFYCVTCLFDVEYVKRTFVKLTFWTNLNRK